MAWIFGGLSTSIGGGRSRIGVSRRGRVWAGRRLRCGRRHPGGGVACARGAALVDPVVAAEAALVAHERKQEAHGCTPWTEDQRAEYRRGWAEGIRRVAVGEHDGYGGRS
jgi:hypothetical protein